VNRRLIVATAAIAVVGLGSAGAFAAWTKPGTGNGSAKAGQLSGPGTPSVGTITATSVQLSWAAATAGTATVKYHVERQPFGGGTVTDVCGSTDAAPISGTSCTDSTVTGSNNYQYQVTAETSNWRNQGGTTGKISTPPAAPTITFPTSSNQKVIPNNTTSTFTITGTNFASNATVSIGPGGGFNLTDVTFVDSQHISVTIFAKNGNGQKGTSPITVSNPGGGSVTSTGCLVNQ
jgi:hypothetical protein